MKTITVKTMLVVEDEYGRAEFWRRDEQDMIWYSFISRFGVDRTWKPSRFQSGQIKLHSSDIILLNI